MKPFSRPAPEDLRKNLSPEQFKVTQQCGTEPPFNNEFWDNHKPGLYVDVVSGEPLFSSVDKFDSGTGWPSFTRPVTPENLVEKEDRGLLSVRTEVRSKNADSHLGHVFPDGPGPTRLRYCINSASLRFIPVERLEAEGYGAFLTMFGKVASGAGSAVASDSASASVAKGGDGAGSSTREVATLAGGCFWGMEEILRQIPGVMNTEVGYTGGTTDDPVYEDVKGGRTGHAESIRITFDPSRLSYEDLLGTFFRMHDPTTPNRQGNDRGSQYRSAIFFHSEAQRKTAEAVKTRVDASGKWSAKVVTEIVPASKWTSAEDYHQKYLEKHPGGYTCHYLRP